MTEVAWDDTGIVTGWLEQDYVLEGKPDHVSAPTTFVLHREDGEWKVALVHSVPLPSP
jgi:ketosteroid isomerase-like protein